MNLVRGQKSGVESLRIKNCHHNNQHQNHKNKKRTPTTAFPSVSIRPPCPGSSNVSFPQTAKTFAVSTEAAATEASGAAASGSRRPQVALQRAFSCRRRRHRRPGRRKVDFPRGEESCPRSLQLPVLFGGFWIDKNHQKASVGGSRYMIYCICII